MRAVRPRGTVSSEVAWTGGFFAYGGKDAEQSATIYFAVPPGDRLGKHADTAEETQLVLSGGGELLLDDGAKPIRPGDVFVLTEGTCTTSATPAPRTFGSSPSSPSRRSSSTGTSTPGRRTTQRGPGRRTARDPTRALGDRHLALRISPNPASGQGSLCLRRPLAGNQGRDRDPMRKGRLPCWRSPGGRDRDRRDPPPNGCHDRQACGSPQRSIRTGTVTRGAAVVMDVAFRPQDGDAVLAEAPVFVEAEAMRALDQKLLDQKLLDPRSRPSGAFTLRDRR